MSSHGPRAQTRSGRTWRKGLFLAVARQDLCNQPGSGRNALLPDITMHVRNITTCTQYNAANTTTFVHDAAGLYIGSLHGKAERTRRPTTTTKGTSNCFYCYDNTTIDAYYYYKLYTPNILPVHILYGTANYNITYIYYFFYCYIIALVLRL